VLFTLDNVHVLDARVFFRYWPVVLIAIGIVHYSQASSPSGKLGGAIWMIVGGLLLANRMGLVHANIWNLWPLLLVLVGGRIVLQTVSRDAEGRGFVGDGNPFVSCVAVMGGFERKVTSPEFRGGEITAFMGGGKLDLRDTVPSGGQAVVNVFALMGGFEILVPETWNVSSEVTPFMGGIEDKARTSASPQAPRLIIRGFVMMGGITLKNS
jgi:predicted membrane protein